MFYSWAPHDDEDSIAETVNYSIKLQPNTVQFYPHMLYQLDLLIGLKVKAWLHIATDDLVTERLTILHYRYPISSSRLLELCDDARMKFYTNPVIY